MLDVLILLLCVAAGTVGGIFFGFSTFIMRALAQLPSAHGVAAMQRINVVVINPMFLGLFIGTALLGVACIISAFLPWSHERSPLLVLAGLSYVIGTVLVTGVFNVPLNDRLERLDPDSLRAVSYWPRYVRKWVRWNHVRTGAAIASAVFSALALQP